MTIGFIGAGKVGCTLGKYFSTHGAAVTGYYDRDTQAAKEAAQFTETKVIGSLESMVKECDVLFITVPDNLIPLVFDEIRKLPIDGKYICHCSGSITAKEAFRGIEGTNAYEYSVHPLFAVSDRFEAYRELSDVFFTIEGNPSHMEDMQKLLHDAGLKVRVIEPKAKTRYHLAAVMSSNLMLALIEEGMELLEQCGFEKEEAQQALTPLIAGNVKHALQAGPVKALTGPVERGDTRTIDKHLAVLDKEEDRELYRLLSKKLIHLAKARNPQRDYSVLEEFLEESK